MEASVLWPQVVYGIHTSLYTDLTQHGVELLEKAILLRTVCDFVPSIKIFTELASQTKHHPAVALEHGLTLCKQQRWKEAGEVFKPALSHIAPENPPTAVGQLIEMWFGITEIFSCGKLGKAWKSMNDVRDSLRTLQIEKYTDIQVACVLSYYTIARIFGQLSSTFPHETYGDIPYIPGKSSRWRGIVLLRRYLQNQGRLAEAHSLLRMEISFMSSKSGKLKPVQDLLAVDLGDTNQQALWVLEGSARLLLADLWRELGKTDEAKQEICRAEIIYQSGLESLLSEHRQFLGLTIEYAKMTLRGEDTLTPDPWLELAEKALHVYNHEVCLNSLEAAAELAAKLLKTGNHESRKLFQSIHSRLDELDEERGDAFARVKHHFSIALEANDSQANLLAAIQWYDNFSERYPESEFWFFLQHFIKTKIIYNKMLGDEAHLKASRNELIGILEANAKFWGGQQNGLPPLASIVLPMPLWVDPPVYSSVGLGQEDSVLSAELSEELDLLKTFGETAGSEVIDNWALPGPVAYNLRSWMLQDSRNGVLENTELERLLGDQANYSDDGEHSIESVGNLEGIDSDQLIERLLGCEGNPTSPERWDFIYAKLKLWLFDRCAYPESHRHFILGRLQFVRIFSLFNDGGILPTNSKAVMVECDRFKRLLPELTKIAQRYLFQENLRVTRLAALLLMIGDQSFEVDSFSSYQELKAGELEARELARQALALSRDSKSLINQATCHVELGGSHLIQRLRGPRGSVTEAFEHLSAAEALYDRVRQDIMLRGGFQAANNAMLFSNQSFLGGVYSIAVCLSLLAVEYEEGDRWLKAWEWIQRAKGRTLSEFIGIGPFIPAIQETPNRLSSLGTRLLGEEQNLVRRLLQVALVDRQPLRQKLKELREEQAKVPQLCRALDVLACKPIHLGDLELISKMAREEVVFVDWHCHSTVEMVTVSRGKPRAFCLPIEPHEVEKVVDKLIKTGRMDPLRFLGCDEALQDLHQLNALVKPIAKISKQGDTIVLCPSGALHWLPLHALEVDHQLLIRRNPIVYCHNLSSLRGNFLSRKAHDEELAQPGKLALFGNPENGAGQEALKFLGERLCTQVISPEESTREAITSALADLRLLHYHGHTYFDQRDVMKHALELRGGNLTVSDIFEARRTRKTDVPFHVTMMSCESGLVYATDMNDVLGLVPAFMSIGAASVVSTLWKVDDEDAATFSKVFYDKFHGESSPSSVGTSFVNYAKALQEAVLAILDGKKRTTLYHWAPFVLHGCWLSRARESTGQTAHVRAKSRWRRIANVRRLFGPLSTTPIDYEPEELPELAQMGDENSVCRLLARRRVDQLQKNTALHFAVAHSHKAIVTLLIRAGASVGFCNPHGETALHVASLHGHDSIMTQLLEEGADVRARGPKGETALHMAARNGKKEAVDVLIDRMETADVVVKNDNGKTAADIARETEHYGAAMSITVAGRVTPALQGNMPDYRETLNNLMPELLDQMVYVRDME
ncbi:hypothetical protein FGG08_002580 [Glutinoglossum americanum]|uniref:CHAT domain-containing protein n=1 Tax=Glutinoglossum americanum TaxID=1670608 RepID=A0A9P8IEW1_9PEZI|nr:hypothetical protein FGG08_002580 [Glutinoglossum americanum]